MPLQKLNIKLHKPMYKYILLSIQATLILIIITCIVTNDKGTGNTAKAVAAYFARPFIGMIIKKEFKKKQSLYV